MKTAVIYFSLTGNTAKVAQMLEEGDTELIRIRKRCSILSLFGVGCRTGFDAHRFDLVVVGCPVWAGGAAKPLMKALKHAMRAKATFFGWRPVV